MSNFPSLTFQFFRDIPIDKRVLMMWRSHTKGVLDMLIDTAKILSREVDDATFEIHNASFVAPFDNIMAIIIITFQTPFVWLHHIIKTHSSI